MTGESLEQVIEMGTKSTVEGRGTVVLEVRDKKV